MKKHDEEYIETDPLVTDIAEACDSTPMILCNFIVIHIFNQFDNYDNYHMYIM